MVSGGGNARHVNGIQSLLLRKHYPGRVTHAGVTGPPWSWEHFASIVDPDHGTLATRVKREFWVSLHRTALLSTTHSLDVLEIMK